MAGKPHFAIFGIPVRVELTFFVVALFALQTRDLQGALVWLLAVFIGVIAHEFGHAVAMRVVGESPFVTLHGLGGVTQGTGAVRTSPRQDFFIALAGPATGLVLGGVIALAAMVLKQPDPLVEMFVADALWINVGWSLVNALPLVPWDGGLALDAGLRWATGSAWPRVVGGVAVAGGVAILVAAFALKQLLLGYFGFMSVLNGARRFSAAREASQGDAMWARVQAGEDVEKELGVLISNAAEPQRKAQWAEMLAWVLLMRRDFAGARRALASMAPFVAGVSLRARLAADDGDAAQVIALLLPSASLSDVPLLASAQLSLERFDDALATARRYPDCASLIAERLFHAGAYPQCLALCTELLATTRDGRHAYNQACCFVKLQREPEAISALKAAVALGHDVRGLEQDDDLASLRHHPEIIALLSSCAR